MEQYIIIGIFSVISLVLLALAIHSAIQSAKAKAEKDEASAAWHSSFERLCTSLLCIGMIVLAILCQQDIIAANFAKVFEYLEVLTHG